MTCLNYFIFFSFGIFFKKILSTNGTAFLGSLNGKKNAKTKREKNGAPTPTLYNRTRRNY